MRKLFGRIHPTLSEAERVRRTIINMTTHYNNAFLGCGVRTMKQVDDVENVLDLSYFSLWSSREFNLFYFYPLPP